MIEIVGTDPCLVSTVEIDPWVPLKVYWGSTAPGSRLYVYVRDPDGGYVELKVDADSGVLVQLVVVDLPREVERELDSGDLENGKTAVLDLGMWQWKVTPDYKEPAMTSIDFSAGLTYSARAGRMAIWFSEQEARRILQAGSTRLGVAEDGELVVVDVAAVSTTP